MPKFCATTSQGLRDALLQEMTELGLKKLEPHGKQVYFEGNWRDCYKANLELATASRVLYSILEFPAYTPDDIYHNVKKHDFSKYIDPEQKIAVFSSVTDSGKIKDSSFASLKVKDAVVDQFYSKFDRRPDVDKNNADLAIYLHVHKNQALLSIDTSGQPLFQRAYRKSTVEAPMKETLAAALVRLCAWDQKLTLIDPMCGSGTLLIEAAMLAKKIAPGSLRKSFAFQKWKGFQDEVWNQVIEESLNKEIEPEIELIGYDISSRSIQSAQENAIAAGVDDIVRFERLKLIDLEAPAAKGFLLTNPPYGERLGVEHNLIDLYKDFGFLLKERFKGWELWMLSGNPNLTKNLGLKSETKIPVMNGAIDCRFLQYKIK